MGYELEADEVRAAAAAHPPEDGPRCARCGVQSAAGTPRCPDCQSWLVGNQGARTLGIYARQQPADLRMTADELVEGIVSDLGGVGELSTIERSYAKKLGDLEILCRALASDLATKGLTTPGGRVRDSYDKLLSGLAAFDRYATKLGMKRRPRPVQTIADIVREHTEGS